MVAYIALIIWIVGLLMFVLAVNPKMQRIGEIVFFSGFLVFTWMLGQKSARLF